MSGRYSKQDFERIAKDLRRLLMCLPGADRETVMAAIEMAEELGGIGSEVTVKVTYFKESGKYYTDCECKVSRKLKEDMIYPKALGKRLRQDGMLPGLISGTWDGPFVIETNYPELVLPEKVK